MIINNSLLAILIDIDNSDIPFQENETEIAACYCSSWNIIAYNISCAHVAFDCVILALNHISVELLHAFS